MIVPPPDADPRRRRVLAQLDAHRPEDADEAAGAARMRAFVASSPAPFSRSTGEGHVTASAMVMDPDGRLLLVHHRALGLWLQPGGHLDPGEEVLAAALREAREETGLTDLEPVETRPGEALLLDVDVHHIPANPRKGEGAHAHHDLCFVLRTRMPESARVAADEAFGLRWVKSAPPEGCDRATRRRLEKASRLATRL